MEISASSTETGSTFVPEIAPVADDRSSPSSARSALAGKYITFQLAGEDYGLEILKVREIIGLLQITPIPRAPGFIRGVINLRGRVIPVVDLRAKFGMPPTAATEQTVVIVLQVAVDGRTLAMRVLVDCVLEVLNIEAATVEPPPDLGRALAGGDFILGVGKTTHRVIFLLDIARVLSGTEASLPS
jgi:purine-binding chemotaxis protein CheW